MIFFPIAFAWLMLLVIAAGLAFQKSTRPLALYIAVCSISGLICSIVMSTLSALLIARARPTNADWNVWLGLVGYIGVVIASGFVGFVASGVALFHWRRTRIRHHTAVSS